MMPATPLPRDSGIKIPVEVKLKPDWRYDSKQHAFVSRSGERFKPSDDLPKKTLLVYKVPLLAKADPSKLTKHERELVQYMQVILPKGESPADYVETIRSWPSVDQAFTGPDISLPGPGVG